jgi:hypothetical protein
MFEETPIRSKNMESLYPVSVPLGGLRSGEVVVFISVCLFSHYVLINVYHSSSRYNVRYWELRVRTS